MHEGNASVYMGGKIVDRTEERRGEFIGSLSANICIREEFDLICMNLTGRFKEADI